MAGCSCHKYLPAEYRWFVIASAFHEHTHAVLLGPLAREMRRQVQPSEDPDTRSAEVDHAEVPPLVLDDLLDRWEVEVEPLLGEAAQQDARLARRARRKAQRGSTREAWQVESQERPAAWFPARHVLEAIEPPVRHLGLFFKEEVSAAAADRLATAAPSVIARAVVDWHFRGPLAELEQLEGWSWAQIRLHAETHIDKCTEADQEEGIFLRRIDRGVEALRAARELYVTYTDFGTSAASSAGWPSGTMKLLADAATEMTSRLRPVRDAAAWRVVDAAKAIEKELSQTGAESVKESWSISEHDGLQLILKVLSPAVASQGGDVASVCLDLVDRLMSLIRTLRETFDKDDLASILDDLLRAVVTLREDISVSDTAEGLEECVQQWQQFGQALSAAERLDAAVGVALGMLVVGLDYTLGWLHVFLKRGDLRAHLLNQEVSETGLRALGDQEPGASHEVCHPPSPSPVSSGSSPRGGYARRPRFKDVEDTDTTAGYSGYSSSPGAVPVAPGFETVPMNPVVPPLPREALEFSRQGTRSGSFAGRTRPGSGRPTTPSWLKPPWQRSDVPTAAMWNRPDTPSTVCDDAEVASLPRWKVVDGQYVPLKTASSGRFLPPLQTAEKDPGKKPLF
ncbi:hypothetical protein AK812_SmicGene17837 [Symbiodinium microadriaticum]|uniref:Uncharacterized protein n=1 Tax=Symbiodinium microadriaticum TaxID=2951 RepID=A0A1Q9DWN6_SYMMI|nr:hypothetical protein AK812_SmicGene17837 [Symbiodinium microadriaticum]